jgi:hypothetical protein
MEAADGAFCGRPRKLLLTIERLAQAACPLCANSGLTYINVTVGATLYV